MDELVEIVNIRLNKQMQIYVYNSDTEAIREVTLVPNADWGGEGCIGADIRTGLLHRIPAPRRPFGGFAAAAPAAPAASAAAPAGAGPSVAAQAGAPAAAPQ